jgi:acyl-coenzyme A thioesterase PaaI-like protein
MQLLPHTRQCFVCGIENPAGLRLDLATDQRMVETRFQFRRELCGFKETVHGGLIATVLDEVMVWAVGVGAGQLSYCGELTVRYQQPTPPRTEVVARGELVENKRGRLFFAKAALYDAAGNLLAESTGKYLPVPGALRPALLADFVEDPGRIFGPAESGPTPTA